MKRLSLVFAAALAFMACGDNSDYDNGTGGSIDSASSSPSINATDDNTTVHPDSTTMDSQQTIPQSTEPGAPGSETPDASGQGNSGGSGNTNTPSSEDNESR